MEKFERLISRAESLIARLEVLLPPIPVEMDWSATAWKWVNAGHAGHGYLQAVHYPHTIHLDDICNINEQKAEILRNTEQFVHGFPANNVLLTGARGTGKSSLVKGLLGKFAQDGLRLVEVDKQDLVALAEIVAQLRNRPEHFIIFCDDLSFEANDPGYKSLKLVPGMMNMSISPMAG